MAENSAENAIIVSREVKESRAIIANRETAENLVKTKNLAIIVIHVNPMKLARQEILVEEIAAEADAADADAEVRERRIRPEVREALIRPAVRQAARATINKT